MKRLDYFLNIREIELHYAASDDCILVQGYSMLDGIINGICAGLGAGLGIFVSRFIVRPFIGKHIKPHFERFKLWQRCIRYSDYDRPLSNQELSWADDAALTMVQDVSKDKTLGIGTSFIYGTIMVMAFLVSILTFGLLADTLLKALNSPNLQGAMSWYRVETIGISIFLSVITGTMFSVWLCARIAILSKNPIQLYSKYTNSTSIRIRSYWKGAIFDLVRKGHISTKIPIDIKRIRKIPFQRISNCFGFLTLLLSGVTIVLLFFDLKFYTAIHKNHIRHSSYMSVLSRNYTVDDIVDVKRSCRLIVNQRYHTGPSVNLTYQLIMSDGHKIKIFGRDEGAVPHYQVHALKHWHSKISVDKLDVTKITSSGTKSVPPTKKGCASLIKRNYSGIYYKDLIRIFDLSHD